jgi:stage V sporulation protein D (sporulation-specific penicillin-binding protein)
MAVRGSVRGEFVRRRMETAFLVILACYLGLIGRLVYLQGTQGPTLRLEATQLREQRIPLRAHRGSLLDRDGKPLAVSLYSGIVGFDPSAVVPDPNNPKKTAKLQHDLADSVQRAATLLHIPEPTLAGLVAEAQQRFNPNKPVRFVPVRRDVPLEMAQQIRDARPRLLGFGVADGSQRVYSSGDSAAQVVGFLGSGGEGAAGLERGCDSWLNGQDGFAVAEVDDRRREIPDTLQRLIPAHDGMDIHTTLDANAQHIVTQEAQRVYDQYHPKGIAAVVVDPNTGDVLALVSLPSFDPNPGQRKTLQGENLADRCAARLYEPGSTLKALTIAAALDDGVINLSSTFFCGGQLQVGHGVIHCVLHGAAERYGHGLETPQDIIRHSCNVGAAQIGLRMGAKRLYAAERKFGLFDPLALDLPAVQHGRLSFDRNEKINSPGKVARVAFGHSITTTPLHVAMAYAALANGGILMQPRLLTSITDANGKTRQKWDPKPIRRVISAQTSAEICAMLRTVVSNGTGKVAAIPGYQVAGKTGTANKYRRGAYVGSFIGFLPASPNVKPRAVILMAVDEPHGAYYGAEVAAPAFQAIARRLMAYWHVSEDDPQGVQAHTAAENLRHQGLPLPASLRKPNEID